MKKLITAALLITASTLTMALSTEQCVANHFITAKFSNSVEYEKDEEIVRIWCQCKWQQAENGMNETETIEYCLSDTVDAVNARLRKMRYPHE